MMRCESSPRQHASTRAAQTHTVSAAWRTGSTASLPGHRGASQGPRALILANTLTLYALAQQLSKVPGRGAEAAAALRRFQEASWPRLRTAPSSQPSMPFERVSLLRQAPGVSPIFPLHAYREGFSRLLAGQYLEAIEEFARAAAADALASGGRIAEHASALRRGQLPAAIEGLETLASDHAATPSRAQALRALGVAYWVAGRFDLSAARLSEAIQLAPEDERARLALADVLVEAGRSAEASQALAATVAALPDSGQAHFRLGQLNLSQSLFPPAVRELETAAGLTPLIGLDRLYEMLGGAYASQASFDDAVAAYLTRIDVNPNNADAHKSLGEIYALQGRHDEALAEFAATLLIDPKNVGALVGASQVFLRIGAVRRGAGSLETGARARRSAEGCPLRAGHVADPARTAGRRPARARDVRAHAGRGDGRDDAPVRAEHHQA